MNQEMSQTLKSLEDLRVRLIKESGYLSEDISYVPEILTRNKEDTPRKINGYPVFEFSYPGSLPLYDAHDKDFRALIRRMYLEATFRFYDFSKIDLRFNQAALIIEHYFKDGSVRDLDNRNRKYVIDAIRATGLIPDDNSQVLTIVEESFLTKEQPYITVFLLHRKHLPDFLVRKKEFEMNKEDKKAFEEMNINAVKELVEKKKNGRLELDEESGFYD
ncbi:hypothetical protein ACA30_13195 [Virgibacillus soli]|uniref:Uncharacterized protein n=1 Tax=Lederbergia galactosidilytica TaxID=217031 RepID=A0A0Q9YIJ4_9BACI|nr:hypothetical protein ACA30_13195 [Virgibacillus soli]KRG16846.1 hypothetical protein ACA29_02905 [Lederbergia galactosidilytica]